jgi:hypothetical protein
MDVLWHENISDQSNEMRRDGQIKSLREVVPPEVVGQERQTSIARKGELMTVTRQMKSLDGLSMAHHEYGG